MERGILDGQILDNVPVRRSDAIFALIGTKPDKTVAAWPISENTLAGQIAFLGGCGSGKTNAMKLAVRSIAQTMRDQDCMVIFDADGEYRKEYFRPGDLVFSASAEDAENGAEPWNLFEEVLPGENPEETAEEVARCFFEDASKEASKQEYAAAAADIFRALILDLGRSSEKSGFRDHASLCRMVETASAARIRHVLGKYEDLAALESFVSDADSPRTLGVLHALQETVRKEFAGACGQKGKASIRRALREKGGKRIFVEYDRRTGSRAFCAVLLGLAVSEVLHREEEEGKVWFILDDFNLLPRIRRLGEAMNHGRKLGARFLLGIQSTAQLFSAYGAEEANRILSGISTYACLHLDDGATRGFFKVLCGRKRKALILAEEGGEGGQVCEYYVVSDADIDGLSCGDAVVRTGSYPPFYFHFQLYNP